MSVAAIIQARLGSSRLPAKILLPLPSGRIVLQQVISCVQKIPEVSDIIVASPDTAGNEIVGHFVPPGVKWMQGPEQDCLARYALAARQTKADVILRITSDCPVLNPGVCSDLIKLRARTGADYASNAWPARSFPHGWDCEVFTRDMLDRADAEATDPYDREHVCPYMQKVGKTALLKAHVDGAFNRWTLDTLDDYRVIWGVMTTENEKAA